jgi:ribonuclease J
MGPLNNLVLRDRLLLADDGIVTIFLAVSKSDGKMLADPDIQARGFVYEEEAGRIIAESRKKIASYARRSNIKKMVESGALRDQIGSLLFERTRRRPVILISLLEL